MCALLDLMIFKFWIFLKKKLNFLDKGRLNIHEELLSLKHDIKNMFRDYAYRRPGIWWRQGDS